MFIFEPYENIEEMESLATEPFSLELKADHFKYLGTNEKPLKKPVPMLTRVRSSYPPEVTVRLSENCTLGLSIDDGCIMGHVQRGAGEWGHLLWWPPGLIIAAAEWWDQLPAERKFRGLIP